MPDKNNIFYRFLTIISNYNRKFLVCCIKIQKDIFINHPYFSIFSIISFFILLYQVISDREYRFKIILSSFFITIFIFLFCIVTLLLLQYINEKTHIFDIFANWIKKYYLIIFIILSLFFGLLYIFITPPFMSPDESVHFLRSYSISKGYIFNFKYKKIVPSEYYAFFDKFLPMAFHTERKTSYAAIRQSFNIDVSKKTTYFVPPKTNNLFVPYLPQTIAIFIIRHFTERPAFLLYAARIGTLLSWIVCGIIILKLFPYFNLTLLLIMFTPMNLYLSSMCSYDSVTISLSYILIALLHKLYMQASSISAKDVLKLICIIFLLSLCKPIYFFLGLLFFTISPSKFYKKKAYFLCVIFMILFSFIGFKLPELYKMLFIESTKARELQKEPHSILQLKFIYNHLDQYILTLIKFVLINFTSQLRHGTVGIFGWLDTRLPNIAYWFYFSAILLSSILSYKKHFLSFIVKTYYLLLFFTITLIIITATYVFWDYSPIGADYIRGFQGRYFLPILPLLFIPLFNRLKIIKILYLRYNNFFITFFVISAISINICAIYTLIHRFYGI